MPHTQYDKFLNNADYQKIIFPKCNCSFKRIKSFSKTILPINAKVLQLMVRNYET